MIYTRGYLMNKSETYRHPSGVNVVIDPNKKIVDLGCGLNKIRNADGVDNFQYPGVDIICDLNKAPWPIKDNSYDVIWANQIIEHIKDVPSFLSEIHRIGRDGAEVHITTPHYSHAGSWGDPTHLRHLGVKWHSIITKEKDYMSHKMPQFELISSSIIFSKPRKFRNILTRSVIKLDGLTDWERKWCFIFRGENIYTILRIVKEKMLKQ
jgi:SAM-dependent methyltransferase